MSLRNDGRSRKSPGIAIAIAGVAIAVAVMMVTLSVVMGFKHSIRDKVIGFDSQILIETFDNSGKATPFHVSDTLVSDIRLSLGTGADISGSVMSTALIKTDNDFLGLTLKADAQGSVPYRFIEENIVDGVMPDFAADTTVNDLVLSAAAASLLDLQVGGKVMVYFVNDGNIKTRRMRIAAVYDTSFGERDKALAICSTSFLRGVEGLEDNKVDRIEINNIPFDEIERLSGELQSDLADCYYSGRTSEFYRVDNVLHTGAVYFNWLDLLDTNVVVIILLMSVVAAFTLISCLFILILERVGMIGILKALGASDMQVRRIFVYMALKIVVAGILIGDMVGLVLLWIQYKWHLMPLDPSAYYLPYVPVEIDMWHVAILNFAAVIMAWLVLIMPTVIISRISPSVTMRYE